MLTSFLYSPKKSFVHYLNSVSKIISLIIFSLITIFSKDLHLILVLMLLVTILFIISNAELSKLKGLLKSLVPISIFILLINIFFKENLYEAFIVVIKIYLVFIYSLLIPMTTSIKDINDGIIVSLKPFNKLFDVNAFALSLTLSINFLSYLPKQAKRIFKIQRSRGIRYEELKLKEKVIHLKDLMLPIFIGAFRKADNLALAMEIRNFENKVHRAIHFSKKDIYAIIFHVALLMIVIWKEVVI